MSANKRPYIVSEMRKITRISALDRDLPQWGIPSEGLSISVLQDNECLSMKLELSNFEVGKLKRELPLISSRVCTFQLNNYCSSVEGYSCCYSLRITKLRLPLWMAVTRDEKLNRHHLVFLPQQY